MRVRLFPLIPLLLFFSCGGSNNQQAPPETPPAYVYTQPIAINDGWQTGTLAGVGMDKQPFLDMVDYLNGMQNHEVHNVLVIKDHTLVFEAYFEGHDYCYSCPDFHGDLVDWDLYSMHNTHSVTKSITSTLIGIAIDQGYISSVQDGIFDYLPEYMDLWNEQNTIIKIKHLLTWSAGLQWNNDVDITSPDHDLIRMVSADDPIRFILEKPVVAPPGTQFHYNAGCTNLLGQICRNATGLSLADYAYQVLLGPLEIGNRDWPLFSNGMEYCSGDLPLTPREMAKIGELFINSGNWHGRQIVSESWIEEATRHHITGNMWDSDGCGYQWWLYPLNVGGNTLDTFSARGWGGQYIMCLPELDMVVVFTGGNYINDPKNMIVDLLEGYILPSVLDE